MNKEQWESSHKCCPQCGSKNIEKSTMAVASPDDNYRDDFNVAKCECGWKGMIKNLIADASESRTIQVDLKTMDKDNEVYVSCWDLVGALKIYQANVIELLQSKESQQQANFVSLLFEEIYKTIISADYQHRTLKQDAIKEIQVDNSEINE